MLPGWTRLGQPVASWSAAGYLNASSARSRGVPGARGFRAIGSSTPSCRWAAPDGVSLVTGLLTQLGARSDVVPGALYLSAIPTSGAPQAGAEGSYLIVSKNLSNSPPCSSCSRYAQPDRGLDVLRSSIDP